MTDVNIYINVILKSEFVYKLISQLYLKSIKLIVVLNNDEEIEDLDFYLWNNVLDSFLAHSVWQERKKFPSNSPIVLTLLRNLIDFDVSYIILNLSNQFITQKTKKIVEVFTNTPEALIKARKCYTFYKSKNFQIKYFDILQIKQK